MKDKVKMVLTALSITLAGFTNAQNTRPISLNEAIDLSIKNSKQLKINKAKVEQASAVVTQAIQRRLPDASVTGSYIYLTNPIISLKTKNGSGGSGNNGSS